MKKLQKFSEPAFGLKESSKLQNPSESFVYVSVIMVFSSLENTNIGDSVFFKILQTGVENFTPKIWKIPKPNPARDARRSKKKTSREKKRTCDPWEIWGFCVFFLL